MLSNDANYNMHTALNGTNQKKLLDIEIDIRLIIQLLIEKGIVTKEEVSEMRYKAKNGKKYKPLYDSFKQEERKMNYYKKAISDYFATK